ncbi:flagellar hook-length control protein FliK [Geomonas nitrogeniifigens]|uniref:Flagellar hook-length control protein FliK n=1 Tax=Geomonas diazotrophica TaxID=2843197 RepID=A0ABX8JFF7_9BACT|nr:flagellar hook-length control protein FliK [Geomonas nitrogeniifigens]QWV97120.1 flagellar hook-length control protein FliK [Geomonas nitrogeniifigens]QXE86292.1 flagellar hook-length control protein FliK [Geomonas nitrogeniifigens]
MMVQNAAFIPDAIPAPAVSTGMATAAAAPGAGAFQQLLQGRQAPAKPAETPSRPTPEQPHKATSRSARGEEKAQPAKAQKTDSSQDDKPAEAARKPAAEKGAVSGKQQGRKSDSEEETAAAQETAAEGAAGTVAQNGGAEQAIPSTPETAVSGQAAEAATGTVPETKPDPNPGLVVATAAIESNLAARSEDANAAAGTTALERLQALQQRTQQEAAPETAAGAGRVQPELPQQAAQTQNQQQKTTAGTAGIELGQKAESVELPRGERKAQVVPSTGATEGAQVEKPQAQVAQGGAERQEGPVLPDAAKTAVAADQTVAAAHLAAKETGAGRFVAMPVRKQAEPATAGDPAATTAAAGQEHAPVQQGTATGEDASGQVQAITPEAAGAAAAGTTGATVRETKPEAGAAQVKVQLEKQGEPATVSQEKTAQAEQAPQSQRKDAHQGEAVTGKQVREAVQAQQANVSKPSGEDVSGTKNATTATASSLSESVGARDASGAQGEQGQSQQKGEDGLNGQMLGAGLTAQGTPAEAVQGEAKLSGGKTFLHESILSQVREGVVTHDGKGNGQMSIRLNPGELGELKIELRMDNNRLNVEVHADNRMVKDLLMSNLDSLREALSGKNLTMEGFSVSTGGGGFNAPLNEERGNQRQQQPPRFARGAGYDGQDAPRVNYLTAEVNSLLDVRF